MEKNPQPGGGLANSSYKVKEKNPHPRGEQANSSYKSLDNNKNIWVLWAKRSLLHTLTSFFSKKIFTIFNYVYVGGCVCM